MPLYLFRCVDCGTEVELLLPLGELDPRVCDECGGTAKHRLARVAVKYDGWGFTSTDSLIGDTRGKDFKSLREKAEQISDE
ncbi:MAG TPA: FmdB family zinc ribbon protein [Mycobacteriales bacterium]|nr:FmdB family zinc ribbon protein [Mycobacteriales bacterium]